MYDYGYNYGYDSYDYGSAASAVGIFAGIGIFMWVIGMAVGIFTLVCMWKLFKKAGKPGWASIVPIYNMIVMIEIAQLPMWYIALFFVPFANIYAMFKIYIEIAHKFGKSTGFGVGMIFLGIIFIPMLALGKAEYKGGSQAIATNTVSGDSNSNLSGQFNVNDNFSVQSNNSQFNMDSNINSTNNINTQGNGVMFQPAGNVNNNVSDINFSSVDMQSSMNLNNVVPEQNTMLNQSMNSFSQPVNVVDNNVGVVPQNIDNSINNVVPNIIPEQNVMLNQGMNSFSQPINVVDTNIGVVPQNIDNSISNVVPVTMPEQQGASVNMQSFISNMKKMCPNCGTQIDFNNNVCNNCGHNL